MSNATAALAQSITRAGSKQSYYTARLLVDRDLVSDFYRAYAYFRWADDEIDVAPATGEERISFIARQRDLIERLYRGERPDDLTREERIIGDLIGDDRAQASRLQSFIRNMLAIIEFDAQRRGRLITQQELTWYSNSVGKSVTDGIQHFVGSGHPYPAADNRYLAGIAAHITHLLRDQLQDTADGFINIPREYLEAHHIDPQHVDSPPFRAWVQSRVQQARHHFQEGKRYLDELDVLRCRIVGYWYCARFEGVLDTIERDGYVLRAAYNERHKLTTWLRMAWLCISVSVGHLVRPRRSRRARPPASSR